MSYVLKRLIVKALEKAKQLDMTDVLAQMNADDIIQILKELL